MNLIRRLVLRIQIRALEIYIDGASDGLECVRDPETINKIIIAQINARNELRQYRREWFELKGRRSNSWRLAA
mgnify:FL=1